MASRSETHFQQASAKLSDSVIGVVLARDRGGDRLAGGSEYPPEITYSSWQGNYAPLSPTTKSRPSYLSVAEKKEKIAAAKLATRRAQLRAGQARYRKKQRDLEEQQKHRLHKSLKQLGQEIQGLKLKRRGLKRRGKPKPSPWRIVNEVFYLLDTSFRSPWCVTNAQEMEKDADIRRSLDYLKTVLEPNVALGKLHGFDALTEQLRRYALYFGEPHLQLVRIESETSCIMRTTGVLSLTITEFTLQNVFPHLAKPEVFQDKIQCSSLQGRLLGYRLRCRCSMIFFFDDESGFVERLEVTVDLLPSLIRALGSVKDATRVLEQALITPGYLLGDFLADQESSNTCINE